MKNSQKFLNPRAPKFEGEDAIPRALDYHLAFVRQAFYPYILRFIQLSVEEVYQNNWNLISESNTTFSINEIKFFAKKGNFCATAEEGIVSKLKVVAEKIFSSVEITKKYDDDTEATMIIILHQPYLS